MIETSKYYISTWMGGHVNRYRIQLWLACGCRGNSSHEISLEKEILFIAAVEKYKLLTYVVFQIGWSSQK